MNHLPPFESFVNQKSTHNNFNSHKVECIYSEPNYGDENLQMNNTTLDFKSTSQHFWKYNACNKGPKKKSHIETNDNDSDLSSFDYIDPIRTKSSCGKAVRQRKSETTGTAPNLLNFLKIRNNIIRSTKAYKETIQKDGKMTPKCRNILASKICRLKKKAYHESLKIKYSALGLEYNEILYLIDKCKNGYLTSAFKLTKIRNKPTIIKAAGRLDDFIHELVVAMDNREYENPVILKLNQSSNSREEIQYIDSEPNDSVDIEEDIQFLIEDGGFIDFLNSSGSTTFTDDLYNDCD